jgi:hypothetical protein
MVSIDKDEQNIKEVEMKLQKNPFQVVEKSIWEISELNETEHDLTKHHAVECKVIGMQMVNSANVKNAVTGQTEPMVAIVAQVVIPIDPRKINSGLITPDGLNTTFKKACPIAPVFRLVLNEEYMCPSYIPASNEDATEQKPTTNIDDFMKDLGL